MGIIYLYTHPMDRKDPPMEGALNPVFSAGVYLGPQNDARPLRVQ